MGKALCQLLYDCQNDRILIDGIIASDGKKKSVMDCVLQAAMPSAVDAVLLVLRPLPMPDVLDALLDVEQFFYLLPDLSVLRVGGGDLLL